MSDDNQGDQAFRKDSLLGRWPELTHGGALSFLRRKYTDDMTNVDVMVSGIPYDGATTYRSGARLGPRAIRAASVQLAELLAFPFGFDPFECLAVADMGDCFVDPHYPEDIIAPISQRFWMRVRRRCRWVATTSSPIQSCARWPNIMVRWRYCTLTPTPTPGKTMANAWITDPCFYAPRTKA